jgi:hypothetical protein
MSLEQDPFSDEAKEKWCRMIWGTSKNENKEDLIQATQIGWQEGRRRAHRLLANLFRERHELTVENKRLREQRDAARDGIDRMTEHYNRLRESLSDCLDYWAYVRRGGEPQWLTNARKRAVAEAK